MNELAFREQWWSTADGRKIKLRDMETSHLVNVLNWTNDHGDVYGERIKDALAKEAKFRALPLFAENKPYPVKIRGKWFVMDGDEAKIIPPSKAYIDAVKDNPAYQKMRVRVQEKRRKSES